MGDGLCVRLLGWCRDAMRGLCLPLPSGGGSAREVFDGRGSLWCVCVWGGDEQIVSMFRPRSRTSGQGQEKKEKVVHQTGTLSPSQQGRGQVYWTVVRTGGSQESGIEIKLAGQGEPMLLGAFWPIVIRSAGRGLVRSLEVCRSVELNRVGMRPRFIHGRGRHSIPGASSPLAAALVACT